MRALRFLNVAILSALVGSAAVLCAQDDKQPEDKPARQEEPKPQPKQDEAKPAHQDDAKPAKQDKQEKQDQKRDQDQSRDQMKPQGQQHPEQQQAGHAAAGKGGHIPDDKFKAHFGSGHHFSARGVIVQGQSQFQYGGYSFQFVDAWPVGWAYTDDCYIDYIDGEYFLFDLLHPGVQVALVVIL